MAKPTILIGIGSGGLKSIEATWKLFQEVDEKNKPLVEYIYLETDAKSDTSLSSDIVYSRLTIDELRVTKKALVEDISCTSSWMSNQEFPDSILSGAGGAPVVGRLALWDRTNRQDFVNKLLSALTRIRKKSMDQLQVYVVGSFGGGTGSGTFLDIAYLIRDTYAGKALIHGLFMIPHTGMTDSHIYSNTICCLKELDYFNGDNEFPFRWAANPPKGYEAINTPYESVQIISTQYNDVLAHITYDQLSEDAGLFLFLNALGLYEVRWSSLKDARDKNVINNYTTFGLSAIHYPESEIKEILGNRYSAEMLRNIIDDNRYFDRNHDGFKELSAVTPQIVNNVRKRFDREFTRILKQWCNQIEIIDTGDTKSVDTHIRSLAHTLASGNYSYDEKRKLLFNLFRAGGEYYKQLRSLCRERALDAIIGLIEDMISNSLNKYGNINVAITELEAIEAILKDIHAFWEANGYTSKSADWEEILKKYIVKDVLPMPRSYKMLRESENVYADRITFILLYGLSMHIFNQNLSDIIDGIRVSNNIIVTSDGRILPTITRLRKWKDIINHVITNPNNVDHLSCVQVEESLITKLSAERGNIEYIYPNGALDLTLIDLDAKYRANRGQHRFIEDITGNDNLYGFLSSIRLNVNKDDIYAEKDLYEKVVSSYVNQIETGSFSVATAISSKDNNDLIRRVEGKSLIPHVPVNPTGRDATFAEHDNIPHIIVGDDGPAHDILKQISDKLDNEFNIKDYIIRNTGRDSFGHPGLKNWLIFYKEFGYMSDNVPFNIIKDLREFNNYANEYSAGLDSYIREKKPDNIEEGMKAYHEKRMPYIDYNRCLEIARQYQNKAISQQQLLEYEAAQESYQYARYWNMSEPLYANKSAELTTILRSETSDDKFTRYYDIAGRYMREQDYPSARKYYLKALKENKDDANAKGQIVKIDSIKTRVSEICGKADYTKRMADDLYTRFSNGEEMLRADCIQQYLEVNAIYESALELSKHDNEVKQRILNVQRRLAELNM